MASQASFSTSSPKRVLVVASIQWRHNSASNPVFVDFVGVDDNFIHNEFDQCDKIPLEALAKPRRVNALDGQLIAQATHRTVSLTHRDFTPAPSSHISCQTESCWKLSAHCRNGDTGSFVTTTILEAEHVQSSTGVCCCLPHPCQW